MPDLVLIYRINNTHYNLHALVLTASFSSCCIPQITRSKAAA
ncbi:hypothetical protein LL947_08230 [Halomonas sp. BLK-85]